MNSCSADCSSSPRPATRLAAGGRFVYHARCQSAVRQFLYPAASSRVEPAAVQSAVWGPNALAGGDLENLQLLQSSGWRNLTGQQPDVKTAVELSLHAPHSGRSALRVQCWPTRPEQTSGDLRVSADFHHQRPVPVQAGQILRIHGWARVPDPIQGSLDGLLIYDSLAGTALAERMLNAPDWREFTLYRAAPRDGTVTMTMALTGIGEVWLDDVTVNLLEPAVRQAHRRHEARTNDE